MKVAILDMYEGVPNEGMRCIREILAAYAMRNSLALQCDEYEVRIAARVPDLSYDLYISTGGPGSPLESEGTEWERRYFETMEALMAAAKPVLLICHSFQLMCRYLQLGNVCRRRSPAFGVFPVHPTVLTEKIFEHLPDPFYIVDSRNWQVIGLNHERMAAIGATVLAIEKERPHVPLERATMAIRFSPHMIGTQFHPEADATGMRMYLLQKEKKDQVLSNYGAEKYYSMLEQLSDPDKIMLTYNTFIPAFLDNALSSKP